MKSKHIAILFLLLSFVAKGQDKDVRAWRILESNGITKENHLLNFYDSTSAGTYISVQSIQPVETVTGDKTYHGYITVSFNTYVLQGDSLSEVLQLDQYRVYGYSASRKAFIVGLYDQESYTDPQIEKLFRYDLTTKQLISQGAWAGGIYRARVYEDHVSLLLNVKDKSGIGSNLTWVPFPIK